MTRNISQTSNFSKRRSFPIYRQPFRGVAPRQCSGGELLCISFFPKSIACKTSYTELTRCKSPLSTRSSLQKTLTMKMAKCLLPEHARVLFQKYEKRELKAIRENELFRQYDKLISNLCKDLKTVNERILDKQIDDTLAEVAKEALQKWDLDEENITSINVFNPFFIGNHPKYKVKISQIILNMEHLKSKIFAFLKEEISKLLKKFKKDAVNLFAQELNSVLEIQGHENIDTRSFVEQSIKDVLCEAQQWYIGRQKQPINEHTVGKYLKESKQVILKSHILRPAYNQSDLKLAKQVARENIAAAVMALKEDLKTRLLQLHNTRWDSFCCHLKARNSIPKLWQVLLSKLKKSCQSENTQQQQPDELSAVLKLITANNPM